MRCSARADRGAIALIGAWVMRSGVLVRVVAIRLLARCLQSDVAFLGGPFFSSFSGGMAAGIILGAIP